MRHHPQNTKKKTTPKKDRKRDKVTNLIQRLCTINKCIPSLVENGDANITKATMCFGP